MKGKKGVGQPGRETDEGQLHHGWRRYVYPSFLVQKRGFDHDAVHERGQHSA